ncbi:transposase [Nonomuraea basaltis]|uniref:transposase n=1 Tax=Nonomuraea basaltis TaxID=2495887 RepID=UPI003B8473B6
MVDHFHVVQLANQAVTEVRRRVTVQARDRHWPQHPDHSHPMVPPCPPGRRRTGSAAETGTY